MPATIAGLTNSDPTDGTFGRHAPNNSRLFDLPTMTYLPNGKIDDGPLSTDRPHTGTAYGFYRLKSVAGTNTLGVTQLAFQGTPINSCLPVVGTSSACQWAEGRGNFVQLTRNADGSISKGDVVNDARTDPMVQTDVNFSTHHSVPGEVPPDLRSQRRQRVQPARHGRGVRVHDSSRPSWLRPPARRGSPGDPDVDWGKVMNGYNYIDALNGTGTFAGVQSPLTRATRYGMPYLFQQARNIRLALRFTF